MPAQAATSTAPTARPLSSGNGGSCRPAPDAAAGVGMIRFGGDGRCSPQATCRGAGFVPRTPPGRAARRDHRRQRWDVGRGGAAAAERRRRNLSAGRSGAGGNEPHGPDACARRRSPAGARWSAPRLPWRADRRPQPLHPGVCVAAVRPRSLASRAGSGGRGVRPAGARALQVVCPGSRAAPNWRSTSISAWSQSSSSCPLT